MAMEVRPFRQLAITGRLWTLWSHPDYGPALGERNEGQAARDHRGLLLPAAAQRPQAAWEQRLFDADRELYNAFSVRRAPQSPTSCIYGNGIISCN